MAQKPFSLSLFLLVAMLFAFNSHSQDVMVKLYQPAPNQWNVADMWNLMLTNTSPKPIKVFLHGTVETQNDGKIFDGKSAVFELTGNFSGRIEPHTLEPANIKYVDSKYEEIVLRTGTMPEGVYTICVYVMDANSGQELAFDCIDQPIMSISPPSLIYPANEAEITEPMPVFTWAPPSPMTGNYSVSYSLKIVELMDGQVPIEAMESNPAWFTEKNVSSTSFQLPISARPMEPGRKYAWQVTAYGDKYEIGKSEVWSFNLEVTYSLTIDSVKIECYSANCYNFRVWVKNNNTPDPANGISNTGEVYQLTIDPSIGTGISCSSNNPPFNLSFGQQQLIIGKVCFQEAVTHPMKFHVSMHDLVNPNDHDATTTKYVNEIPECPCCVGFTKQIRLRVNNNIMKVKLKAGPLKICKVSMKLAYLKSTTDENCPICKDRWNHWGIFTGSASSCSLGPFGFPTEIHQREITWGSDKAPGYNISNSWATGDLGIMLDPVVSGIIPADILTCCETTIEYCIRYSFTDTTCMTCDTVICYRRTVGGPPVDPSKPKEGEDKKDPGTSQLYIMGGKGGPNAQSLYLDSESFDDSGEDVQKNASRSDTLLFLTKPQELISSGVQSENKLLLAYNLSGEPSSEPLLQPAPSPIPPPTYPVTVTITSDNAYVFGFGDMNGITDYHSPGVCNKSKGDIYYSYGPETYHISANMDGYIYIAAWSDEKSFQGLLAQFTSGNTTIVSGPNLPNPNIHWEVYATGSNLYCSHIHPPLDDPCPILQDINDQISIANGPPYRWVGNTPIPGKGALSFGPVNQINNTIPPFFPCATVPGISTSAKWMWWRPVPSLVDEMGSFVTGAYPYFPATDSKEYYIFRVGPIGELFPPPGCCDDFDIKIKSEIVLAGKEQYMVKAGLSAGPNKIRRVTAEIIDFSVFYNSSLCRTCVNNSDQWGNFIMTFPPIPGLGQGNPTIPPGTTSRVSREVVWGSLYKQGVDMTTSIQVGLNLSLPPKHISSCCLDRIDLCVKYKFTDELCITCDTVICYKIYRPEIWKGGQAYPPVKDYDDIIDIQDEMIRKIENHGNMEGGTETLESDFIEVETIQQIDSLPDLNLMESNLDKAVDSPCYCGIWNNKSPFSVQLENGSMKNYYCGTTHEIKNKGTSVRTIKVMGHTCKPQECNVSYKWEVRAYDNSLIKSGDGPEISYDSDLAGVSFPVNYKVVFYALCDGLECKTPCVLGINRQREATSHEQDSRKL